MSEPDESKDRDAQRVALLLRLEGAAFVDAAFRALLGRTADPSGRASYVRRLGAGVRKRTILADLAFSAEAKMRGEFSAGFRRALAFEYRLRRFPWLLRLWEIARAGDLRLSAKPVTSPERPAALPREGYEALACVASLPGRRRVRPTQHGAWQIDSVRGGHLFLSSRGEGAAFDLVIDGRVVACFEAPRGVARVSVAVPAPFAGVRPHAFQVVSLGEEGGVSDVVYASPRAITCSCDVLEETVVEGWCAEADVERSVSLVLRAGDRVLGSTVASLPRPDVGYHLGSTFAAYGFKFELKRTDLCDEDELSVSVEGVDDAVWKVGATARFEDVSRIAVEARRAGASPFLRQAAATLERLVGHVAVGRTASTQRVFTSSSPRRSDGSREVAVVIPVYSGVAETIECVESVLAAVNRIHARVVLVNDCAPESAIVEFLEAVEARRLPHVLVVHRLKNGGFSSAVNIGMACAPGADVVLLNADTVVGDGWLDRLVGTADGDERIGTVTPFSNNAELCTIPAMCVVAPVRSRSIHARLDAAAASVNGSNVVDLPVAHGFCMFIRRACLDDVGDFDAATWGRGYGEEVDFCIKASSRGWRHVLAATVFVTHRGGVSFGKEKFERVLENNKKISERYPFYDAMIQRFIAADPLRAARRSVSFRVLAEELAERRVLHIVHAFGGGTERYVRDLARLQRAEGYVSFTLRVEAGSAVTLTIDVPEGVLEGFFPRQLVERFEGEDQDELFEALERFRFVSVHLHTSLHVSDRMLAWFRAQRTLRLTVHDYVWCCPRVTLSDDQGAYCGEPDAAGCNACMASRGVHGAAADRVQRNDGDITRYRAQLTPLFAEARTIFVAGHDVKDRMRAHGFEGAYRVIEHPRVEAPESHGKLPSRSRPARQGAIVVGLIGALSAIKGSRRLHALAARAKERRLAMRFVVFGYTDRDDEIRALGNVEILGAYEEDSLASIMQSAAPDVVLFPNEWPETYSYTLRHAFELGVWPVVTDLGVPAERVRAAGWGTVLERDMPVDRWLDRLVEVGRQRREVDAAPSFGSAPRRWSDYVEGQGEGDAATSADAHDDVALRGEVR
jgi:GT2 family glycosyltransferase/glycosyltransferase involved in cell wall biosynthesis